MRSHKNEIFTTSNADLPANSFCIALLLCFLIFGPLLTNSAATGMCLIITLRNLRTFLGFSSVSPSLSPFWAMSWVADVNKIISPGVLT